MNRPHLLPAAELELLDAVFWYEAQRPGLGTEFLAAVDSLLDDIGEEPAPFPEWPYRREYRRAVLRRFPYLIFFKIADFEIQVVTIAHAGRRPGYWLARVGPT